MATGKLSALVPSMMQMKVWEGSSEKPDFSMEAARFAEANPRVNLGRVEKGAKIAIKNISDIGSVIKSDIWEILKLAQCDEAPELPHFEELLNQEIQSRLKWVAQICVADPRSDVTRYGMFVFAGLISDIIAAKATEEDDEASSSKCAAILSSVVKTVPCRHVTSKKFNLVKLIKFAGFPSWVDTG